MKVYLTCTYCNKQWNVEVYNSYMLKSLSCIRCNDKKLIVKEKQEVVVDTYAGAPPFPEKADPITMAEEPDYWNTI